MRTTTNVLSYLLLAILISCKPSFESVNYGSDACAHCKMTIIDKRYAAELVTKKGRVFKFDDIRCLKEYVRERDAVYEQNKYFVAPYDDYSAGFLDATHAVFLQSGFFGSPMNGHWAAFASPDHARYFSDSLKITPCTWEQVK